MHGAPLAYVEERRRNPIIRPHPGTTIGRAIATKQTVQLADVLEEPNYSDPPPGYTAAQLPKLAGARTVLAVPMIKEDELIGVIVIYRQEVRPFTDKQIELVKNFAAQAVIAIENTRLLNELRQRTIDLTDRWSSRPQHPRCLRVISSSPGELEPVFRPCWRTRFAFATPSLACCSDTMASIRIWWRSAAPPRHLPNISSSDVVSVSTGVRQIAGSCQCGQSRCATFARHAATAIRHAAVEFGGARTTVGVPMLKDDELIGAISMYRQEVRPFTDKQIELVTNFAAQAVIAIENTRLLNELREICCSSKPRHPTS